MKCNVCGTLLPPEAVVCQKCGALASSNPGYDAIPYIETQTYLEQPAPSSTSPTTPVQETPLATIENSIATYPEQRALQSRRIPGWMMALLILLSLLLIIGGISSVVYATKTRPADLHMQATAVTQNFLTAQAQSTLQADIQANTMTPEQVYQQATSGTPVINDPLKDDSGNSWYHHDGTTHKNICNFHAGSYHIQTITGGNGICLGYKTLSNNMVFQAQIKIIQGTIGGIVFHFSRNNDNSSNYYAFGITADGGYILSVNSSKQTKTLKNGINTAIIIGLNQPNLLTVISNKSHIYLYINGQAIDNTIDATYTSGEIGFAATSSTGALDIAFNNVKVWEL